MCGRYAFKYNQQQLSEIQNIIHGVESALGNYLPTSSYNIAPTDHVATIIGKQLTLSRWGLTPSWAKDDSFASKMINARAETLSQKPSFKGSFKRHRCIIPANGYYEWSIDKGGKKRPYYIKPKNQELFLFAALFDVWEKNENHLLSSTIITTSANNELKKIHERMPAILKREDIPIWLDNSIEDTKLMKTFLKPSNEDLFESYEVSTFVNSPKNDESRCNEKITLF